MTLFDRIWQLPNTYVESGRLPGYVGAVRIGDRVEVQAVGRMGIERDSPPMSGDTLFRLASMSKPIGAALTLGLVQDGTFALDDQIARWLSEARSPRVLIAPDAPLDHTTRALRPITVRHLLTMTCGWGLVLEETPLQKAMVERGVNPGPLPPRISGDEFVARVAGLPLASQPGDGWRYDIGMEILGVLLARATGQPLSALLSERITGPLGMSSTSFWTANASRLATAYTPGPNGLELLDPPIGLFAAPPAFEELGAGLVSTAADLMRFFCAMADGGGPVLTTDSVALMTSDALTEAQRLQALPIVGPGSSWGLGTGVDIEVARPWMAPGRWGWNGGTGTTARVDPVRGTVAVLLTQRALRGEPEDGFDDFWAAIAAAA